MSPSEIDTLVFFFINIHIQNSILDALMPFISKEAYLFFLPVFLWFFYKDRKKTLIVLILAILSLSLSDWIGNSLKYYFERIRPCNALDGVRLLLGCSSSFSMPSNHSVNAFAFAIPFFILFKNKIRYVFVAVASLVAVSRIYVGVHYPSDVLVGAFIGSTISIFIILLYNWSLVKGRKNPYTTILFIFLLAISLFRIYYILNGPLDLSPDEAHYWEWSRRLDLSYYSKGPMISYLIYIGTFIFGDSVFGVRIMAVVFSALSSIFLFILGKKLYDEKVGFFSAVILQIIPLFSTYGVIFTIDSPLIFFWILSLLLFWKAIRGELKVVGKESEANKESQITNPKSQICWYLLGISVGLGLLTKYTIAFFYICALLFLISSKELRRYLLTKEPYLAFIISIMIFSPVIIWNANHEWVTLKHTAGQAHISDGFQISLTSSFEFLGSQFGVITPLVLLLMAISIWKLRNSREGAFLYWFSVPVVCFFILKSIHAKVQANWALPGYITATIAFSSYYMKRYYTFGKGVRILIAVALITSLGVTSIAHYTSILNIPVKHDPTSRLRGWKDLGKEITRIYEDMSSTQPVFIFSDSYQVSSQLAFYVKGHPVTYCINDGRRMNQYDLWPGFNDLLHYNAIFVNTGDNKLPEKIASSFQKVEKRVFKAYTKERVKIRDYSIFLCYDFKGLKEKKPVTF